MESCGECERLLSDYIAALRALQTAADEPRGNPEQGVIEARRRVQEALRPLLRHQYAHSRSSAA
jgi:hypothetical protein